MRRLIIGLIAFISDPSLATEAPGDTSQIKRVESSVWVDVDLKNSPAAVRNNSQEIDPLVKKNNSGEWTAIDSDDAQPRCKKAAWLAVGIPIASLALAGGGYLLWHFFG